MAESVNLTTVKDGCPSTLLYYLMQTVCFRVLTIVGKNIHPAYLSDHSLCFMSNSYLLRTIVSPLVTLVKTVSNYEVVLLVSFGLTVVTHVSRIVVHV